MIAVRCQQRRLDLDLAIALNLVLAQRPLRLLCAKCLQPTPSQCFSCRILTEQDGPDWAQQCIIAMSRQPHGTGLGEIMASGRALSPSLQLKDMYHAKRNFLAPAKGVCKGTTDEQLTLARRQSDLSRIANLPTTNGPTKSKSKLLDRTVSHS